MATYTVNVNGVNVKTTVANKSSFVDSFITELVLSCNYSNSSHLRPIIGLDVEYKVSDDSIVKAATLQLCSGSRCIIIQLCNMSVVPESLINLLSAPLFCFVGVRLLEKARLLRRDYGLECRNVMELRPILDMGVLTGCIGVVPKPLNLIMSNWDAENLSMKQIESAAEDAHMFFKFGKMFFG
ncbi:Werner Syndrome-like exonuclease [Quillaja saponaria]|uniref:Werner Syndrome-like exonuclease n=1 Tax=Quillaja saponaria TaxID=32244 RepID=A0AAD7Q1H5_QUISA|nr:Werner Syndrome-like exonuclease [Quillaja saponaria]